MAIEGDDWLYLGGAALGGAILGAIGQSAFAPAPAVRGVDVVHRRYRHGTRPGIEAEAAVVADFRRGAIVLEVYHPEDGGVAVTTIDRTFHDPAAAAEWMDKWAQKNGLRPAGPWSSDALEEIGFVAPSGAAVSGRRRRA